MALLLRDIIDNPQRINELLPSTNQRTYSPEDRDAHDCFGDHPFGYNLDGTKRTAIEYFDEIGKLAEKRTINCSLGRRGSSLDRD